MFMLTLRDKTLKFLATLTILSDQCHLVFCFGFPGAVERRDACLCFLCVTKH